MDLVNLDDYRRAASERLEQLAFDYYRSGANDEITLRENRSAFSRLTLFYRVLVDVSSRQLETEVLGHRLSLPICVAPTAFHQMACSDGEAATARAAGRAGTLMILSTLSNVPVEEVAAASSGPLWFQLYVYKDREATKALIERVAAAGCSAIVMTVDAPLLGSRERDVRNRFHLPPGLTVSNLTAEGYGAIGRQEATSGLSSYVATLMDQSLSWRDIDWLRSVTDLPILIKGIVRPDDALRAADAGVHGVVVSNHGGRQLDTAPATIEALPRIADALAARHESVELLVDGGVRRGTDIVKALALGARAVLLGRPILWGLAVDGEDGATRVLELLREEFDLAMALCGCPDIDAISRDLLEL